MFIVRLRCVQRTLLFCLLGMPFGCSAAEEPASQSSVSVIEAAESSASQAESRQTSRPALKAEAEDDEPRDANQSSPSKITFGKVKFKSGDGAARMSLKPQADGAKLVDANEKEIARYNLQGNKLKVKDAKDKTLAYVVSYPDRLKVKNADQSKDLWNLRRQPDGDWKLESGDGTLVCRMKKRDYGFEIEKPDDTSLRKVKLKSGKLSLRNQAEETYLYTKDSMPPAAAACLALEQIESESVRMGLATMMLIKFK